MPAQYILTETIVKPGATFNLLTPSPPTRHGLSEVVGFLIKPAEPFAYSGAAVFLSPPASNLRPNAFFLYP